MPIVDNAVYVDGRRTPDPVDLTRTDEAIHERHGFGWIGLYKPSAEELHEVAKEFGLHPLAVEDAMEGHQRPKIERYGNDRFVVMRPARYIDKDEEVEFGEVALFLGPDFVVQVRQAEMPDLRSVRKSLEERPDLLKQGPAAVLYGIADRIVDDYVPVADGLQNDIDEIEDQLFSGDLGITQRIYELSREVMLFQRAILPLIGVLTIVREELDGDQSKLEVRRGLRDVLDHLTATASRVDSFRTLLQNALSVNSTLVAQRQNEETRRLTEAQYQQGEQVKKVSSWAAIGFAPTIIAGIYGMNFHDIPELSWTYGYPYAIGLMVGVAVFLYLMFRRRNWL